MILRIEVKTPLPAERGLPQQRPLPLVYFGWIPMLSRLKLLKDNSSSIGLRHQKLLVQIQVKAMHLTPLIITTSLLLIFITLLVPIISTLSPSPKTNEQYSHQVKTAIKISFIISLFPLFLFFSEGTEIITSHLN